MKIVLTGAAGFLGRALHTELVASGHGVVCIVRKPSGFPGEVVADLDALSLDDLTNIFTAADCVAHLAALANFRSDFDDAVYRTNCICTLRIVDAARVTGSHLVFASNALIAGIRTSNISADTPDAPDIPYNIAKYISELRIKDVLEHYAILRIGGIYGLGGPRHLYLNRAIQDALAHGTLPTVNSSGSALRNYIYVKDLARWIRSIIEQRSQGRILMAGPESSHIRDILQLVADLCLPGQGSVNELEPTVTSFDQIIHPDPCPVELHTYRQALADIVEDYRRSAHRG